MVCNEHEFSFGCDESVCPFVEVRVGDFESDDDEEPAFRSLKFCLFKTAIDLINNWSIKFMC